MNECKHGVAENVACIYCIRNATLQEIINICENWIITDLPRHGYQSDSFEFKKFVSAQKSGLGNLIMHLKELKNLDESKR